MRGIAIIVSDETIAVNIYDFTFGNVFLDMNQKYEQQKNKLNFVDIKNFVDQRASSRK